MAKKSKAAVVSSQPVFQPVLSSKVNLSEVAVGDIFSESSHYVLTSIESDYFKLKHVESGAAISLTAAYVEKLLSTADQYVNEVKVTKEDKKEGTPGIRTIWDSIHSDIVFTVCYKKQDNVKTNKKFNEEVDAKLDILISKIEHAQKSKKGVADAAREALKELANNPILKIEEGEDRELRGYKIDFQSRDGKYNCMDMDLNDVRPVNINTIKWLVIGGTKYIVE